MPTMGIEMKVNIDTQEVMDQLSMCGEDAAHAVESTVKANAPVRTGRLRASVVGSYTEEQGIDLNIGVNYAVYTEIRTGWLSNCLGEIGDVTIESYKIE